MKKTKHGGKREGAGRKPLGLSKMQTLSVRLGQEARQRLDDHMLGHGIGPRQAIEKAILKSL